MPELAHNIIKHSILILEDEPEILEDLSYKIKIALEATYSNENKKEDDNLENQIVIEPFLNHTDNLDDAERLIFSGDYDLLIADFKVKETKESKKDNASCLIMLEEMKQKKAFIPVIGHTAFSDLMDDANRRQLTIETVSKSLRNSVQRVAEKGEATSILLNNYKKNIMVSFELLEHAIKIDSPIDQQMFLKRVQQKLAATSLPAWAPFDYKRALITLTQVVLRLTSIPSELFGLNKLSSEFVKIIEPLVGKLCEPIFRFSEHGIPIFRELESAGYNVFMRIEDEE